MQKNNIEHFEQMKPTNSNENAQHNQKTPAVTPVVRTAHATTVFRILVVCSVLRNLLTTYYAGVIHTLTSSLKGKPSSTSMCKSKGLGKVDPAICCATLLGATGTNYRR